MYEAARGPIPPGMVVRHRCDNPACVNPAHLEVGTHADNRADCVARNRHAKGESNGRAKLTSAKAEEIRRRLCAGERKRDLAREFGVTSRLLRFLELGRIWRSPTPAAEVAS